MHVQVSWARVKVKDSQLGLIPQSHRLIHELQWNRLSYRTYVMWVFCQTKPASGQPTTNNSNINTADMISIATIILSCWRRDGFTLWMITPPTIGPIVCASPKHRPTKHIIGLMRTTSYHIISSYYIVVLKLQNRLKVGTDKPKLKVKRKSVSDDDVLKRLLEKQRSELAAKGVFKLRGCYIFW